MFNAGSYMITIAEMEEFVENARGTLSTEEYEDLVTFLAEYPDAGEMIPDTGGVRVVRWPAKSQGRKGRALVVYYFRDLNMPVYLITVLPRSTKLTLSDQEKAAMRNLVNEIVNAAMKRRLRVVWRA